MTDSDPILPSTPDGLRAALNAAGIIYPTHWDDAQLRKAVADDPTIIDFDVAPLTVTLPEVPAVDVGFVQGVAQSTVDAVWAAGWRPQDTLAPQPAAPVFKAALNGNELTIVSMPRRITHRRVIRDEKNQIVEFVDIEEDAP